MNEVKMKLLESEQKLTIEKYKQLNKIANKGKICFAGSSLMQYFPINELLQSTGLPYCIYNRGVAGYTSSQMLENLDVLILDLAPAKLFINIGTNDIGRGIENELWENYPKIIRRVKSALPKCEIYIMAYYPCNNIATFGRTPEQIAARFKFRTPEVLNAANEKLKTLAESLGCRYINVNDGLSDETGCLREEFSIDGIHMYPYAYIPILHNLMPYL